MPSFAYQAKDAAGKTVNGVIEAENERVLRAKLREMNYYVTGITQKSSGVMNADLGAVFSKFKGVSEQALVVFARQFATMINAGLAMVRCLDVLGVQTEDSQLKPIIVAVRREVEGGSTLAAALGKFPKVFSPLFTNMVRAGELGGILDDVLNRLAGFLEKDFNLKKKVKAAMTYPTVILVMAVGIVIFLVTFILPTFVSMFEQMDMKLPLPTKILITFTVAARNPFILIPTIILLIVGFIMFNRYTSTQVGRRQFDAFKLKLPVFGMLIRKVAISRFCRTLGTLLQSGVPIMQALEIVGKASGNEVVAETVNKANSSVGLSATPTSQSNSGQTVTLTARVTPSIATGTVQFLDGSVVIGTASLANGNAVFATSSLSSGNHSIKANYTGDGNVNGSESSALPYKVKH